MELNIRQLPAAETLLLQDSLGLYGGQVLFDDWKACPFI
jgi:hypothetical protein